MLLVAKTSAFSSFLSQVLWRLQSWRVAMMAFSIRSVLLISPFKYCHRIHPNDSQRITRALEVFELSGKTLSELQGNKQPSINHPIKKIILQCCNLL
jgi:hypothetical protein